MNYCSYFQAQVVKEKTWFFVATLRSFEHYAFDRTLDKQQGVFEFFVPQGYEKSFIELMNYYQQTEVITRFEKLKNRLMKDLSVDY